MNCAIIESAQHKGKRYDETGNSMRQSVAIDRQATRYGDHQHAVVIATDLPPLPELRAFAVQTAEAAGPIALRYFRIPVPVDNKATTSGFDPVTVADREIESFIRERIRAAFPAHDIVGEEFAAHGHGGTRRWVIDPIDGTRSFIAGMPLWGILLGLVVDERSRVGVVHQPYLAETFSGTGTDAVLSSRGGHQILRTKGTGDLGQAILYSTSPDMFSTADDANAFAALAERCRLRRFGGDCYAYCLLAAGTIDLVVEAGLAPYDIIPLIPIIEGAGGIVTDWLGGSALAGGRIIAAANRRLHAQALAVLDDHGRPEPIAETGN